MGTLPKQGSAEVIAPATPEQVWAVLTDVTRTGEWSHEAVGAEWLDGSTAATPGARFRGRNRSGRNRWTRTCEVLAAERPGLFRFRTIATRRYPDSTVWTFEIEPVPEGTRITQRFEIVHINPIADRLFYALLPPHRDRSAALREDIERLAALAEGAGADAGWQTPAR